MSEIIIEDETPANHDYHPDDVVFHKHEADDEAEELLPNLTSAQDALSQFMLPDTQPVEAPQGTEVHTGPDTQDEHSSADIDAGIAASAPAVHTGSVAPSHLHSHAMDTAQAPEVDLPRIELVTGQIGETLTAIEALLAASGRFFHRGDQVVELRKAQDGDGCEVKVMTTDSLQVALASMSQWWRLDARTGNWSACDPKNSICRLLLCGMAFKHLKPLKGTSSQPHLRPDGSLCLEPGYDDATGIYGAFAPHAALVSESPTREEACAAIREIEELLSEVAFATEADKAAALAAILTAAVRPSLIHAPLFHVTAHQPGAGKSYLCELIATFASAKPSSKASFPSSNEECGKLLLAQLMRSPAVIEFDNLTTDIKPHDKLCTTLTSDHIEGRVLGTSSTAGLSTRALFLSSGNNVKPLRDMLRRTVVIHLDPKVETPSDRTFSRPNLLADVRRDRTRYVTAALTVVRAWLASGDKLDGCKPVLNFGEWSKWCRESLIWLGCEDPAAGLFAGLESDPDKLLLGRVLDGWKSRHGASVVMVRNLVPAAMRLDADEDFRDALIEASGGIDSVNVRKLGHWLSHNEGRIVSGLRLVKARKTGSAQNWCVEEVTA